MENLFVVEQKRLLNILAAMQPICTKRTTIDATTYILFSVGFKELVMKSTDLEISLQASCGVKSSTVISQNQFLVSGRRIFELVKELEGDIEFCLTERQLLLQANGVKLALNIRDVSDFPPFPERIENLMQIDTALLLPMLNKVAFLIPQNNANPALNGLLVEISNQGLKMTATDGHCLVQASSDRYTLDQPLSWLLPRRAVFEVKKILESSTDSSIFIGICNSQLVFSGESFNFFTKLVADSFPQYAAILSKESFGLARIDRTHFIKTLRRSSCLLSGQFIATSFSFAPEKLKVSMQNKEVGNLEEELGLIDFSGAVTDISFYAPYLLNGIQVLNDDTVTFYLYNKNKPIIFESCQDAINYIYLVMPVAAANG